MEDQLGHPSLDDDEVYDADDYPIEACGPDGDQGEEPEWATLDEMLYGRPVVDVLVPGVST